jgi:hypothetical protein
MRSAKLLKKVLTQRFTFDRAQADLELLRAIAEETYVRTKPGDPSFHAYAAAVNVVSEFASQALDLPELVSFNNQLADIQEEYMPSYPPVSPVTSAFFAGWMALDARDSLTGLTLGEVFVHYLEHTNKLDYLRRALVALNESSCSFHEVMDVDGQSTRLREIAGQQEVQCWSSSRYSGRKGEIWYVRVLPPFAAGSSNSVTLSTPYVFRDCDRQRWEDFFARYAASEFGSSHSLREYLKFGKSLGYWLEFVFQAFEGYTGNMIQVRGVPDNPASLPHSHPKHKL